ncbi:MAG: hypothetical protein M3011_13850 [Actinomycetota bacterium]|nr:hypothetical protein [Actinomycetota bacterium]
MADWATISSLATAGGTLILAIATFSSVRSANRAARTAERSLMAGIRPLLIPSRLEDPPEKIFFGGGDRGHWVVVAGGHAVAEVVDGVVYLALALRNAGNGIAVLDRWCFYAGERGARHDPGEPSTFRRLTRDIYVPRGDLGFWQGSFRDPNEPEFGMAAEAIRKRGPLTVELQYGDHEGGQRTISRFALIPAADDSWLTVVSRHWNLDREQPRS